MYDPIKDCDTNSTDGRRLPPPPPPPHHHRQHPHHHHHPSSSDIHSRTGGRDAATVTYPPPPMDRYPAYLQSPSDYSSSRGPPSYSHHHPPISPSQNGYLPHHHHHQQQHYDDSPGRGGSPQSSISPAIKSQTGRGGGGAGDTSPHGTGNSASSSSLAASMKPTLKRNQACLQCRRRKLKCDAARPHCKTCVRSYNHALRGADASRRERIRERQRERGEEEEKDDAVVDGVEDKDEPSAESLIPALSCTYEDPTEIQAKRQESAALTQKRYGQQIGAARILVEGLAGGSGLVRVDSSGDEVWETARHPGGRKRSVGSLMGGRNGTPEYGRAGKRRDTSQTHEQQQHNGGGDGNGSLRARPGHAEPQGQAVFIDPGLVREGGVSSGYPQTSPGSTSRRPPLPVSEPGYHPGGYPNQPPIDPSIYPNAYPYVNHSNGGGMSQSLPGRGPPWEPTNHMPPSSHSGYDGYNSSYDRSSLMKPDFALGLGYPGTAQNYISPGPPPHMLDGLVPPSSRSNGPPFAEPLLPSPISYGPPESSARESLRGESIAGPGTHVDGGNGMMNGANGLASMGSMSGRMSTFPDEPNDGASGMYHGSERHSQNHQNNRNNQNNDSNVRMAPPFDVSQLDPHLSRNVREQPGWNGRESVPGAMPQQLVNGEAEENAHVKSKIAWLEAGLKRDGSSRGAPSIGSVDPRSTSGSRVESVTGISNGTSQTGGPEDGNMLALLSQAIDQSGYEPVTGHTAPNGQRECNLDVGPTFPGIVTPLKPNTIFEIAPAESWATTIDSSRARTLANILNETNDVDMSDVKPFELSGSDGMVGCHGEENSQADAEPVLWDLLWPGWNKNLPNPELMDHIIEVFFHHVPTVTRLFHYDTFKARMALPATHKDFPNVAVLHGICAASARYTARVFTCNPEDEPWLRAGEHVEDPQREEDFGIRHQLFAWQAINTQLNRGVRIYESAQALILLANHHHMYARWAEGWVCIGLAARLMPPLGLGMRERANAGTGPAGKGPFLSPSLNGIEREERRALFWASVLYDIQISASSGWAGILQQDEIFVPLPASLEAFEAGATQDVPESDQTLHSPDLWSRHPARDGFVFHVKAMCLFHRVNKFIRLLKAKRSIGGAEVDARATKEFQDLDTSIATFLLTFPTELRDPLTPCSGKIKKPIDVDLFTSRVVLYQAQTFLHEPFANLDIADDPSNQRLLDSSRSILKMIFAITSTCLDLSLISRADFGLHTAARTLVLFLKHAVRTGDTSAGTVEQLRSEVEVFRLAFIAHGKRFPIGLRHTKVLEAMLAGCVKKEPPATNGQLVIEPAQSQSPADAKRGFDGVDTLSERSVDSTKIPGFESMIPPASTRSEPIALESPVVSIVTPLGNGNQHNGRPVKKEPVMSLDTKHESADISQIDVQVVTKNGITYKRTVSSSPIIQA